MSVTNRSEFQNITCLNSSLADNISGVIIPSGWYSNAVTGVLIWIMRVFSADIFFDPADYTFKEVRNKSFYGELVAILAFENRVLIRK
jgi:uncharacterized membrane protein